MSFPRDPALLLSLPRKLTVTLRVGNRLGPAAGLSDNETRLRFLSGSLETLKLFVFEPGSHWMRPTLRCICESIARLGVISVERVRCQGDVTQPCVVHCACVGGEGPEWSSNSVLQALIHFQGSVPSLLQILVIRRPTASEPGLRTPQLNLPTSHCVAG